MRDVGDRVIVGERYPDHAAIARFRARHETALGGLFSQVLRLLAAGGMVWLGKLSLDGTKLAGDALAAPTPRTMAMRAERRARLARARDRLTAEDQARCDAQRATKDGWDTAAAAGVRRGRRPADDPPRPNRNNTDPRVNITDPDVRIIRNQKGYVAGDNGQLVVTEQQVIVAVDAQSAPGRRHAAAPAAGQLS